MAKLYFKYGAMGSSKTAQALITKYNYEENDLRVWLLKPSADVRDGEHMLSSRIGLTARADILTPETDAYQWFRRDFEGQCDVIIVDECQFLTVDQIDQLRQIVDDCNIPVMCFGLRTDFQTHLFPGSLRLMEVADTIQDQDHLRLRSQSHSQCPDRQHRPHCYPGRSGISGGQRQLHRHVPQVLCPGHQRSQGHSASRPE